jgi:hypothetical protein
MASHTFFDQSFCHLVDQDIALLFDGRPLCCALILLFAALILFLVTLLAAKTTRTRTKTTPRNRQEGRCPMSVFYSSAFSFHRRACSLRASLL